MGAWRGGTQKHKASFFLNAPISETTVQIGAIDHLLFTINSCRTRKQCAFVTG